MIKEEIYNYIKDNFDLDLVCAGMFVWNIVALIVDEVQNVDDRISFAGDLLDGLGLTDEELKNLFSF